MQPVLFEIPGAEWQLQSYGFFIGLALIVGWFVSLTLAARSGMPSDKLGVVYVVAAATGLLAARAGWLVQHPDAFVSWRSLFILSAGQLAGFVGAVVAFFVGARLASWRGIKALAWADTVAPACAVGLAFERVGAWMAGTAYGRYAPQLPWAVRFPAGSPVFADHQRNLSSLLPHQSTQSLPVHPTQLYGVLLAIVAVFGCVWLWNRRRFDGQVFLAFCGYWLAVRAFVEEPLRADAPAGVVGPLHTGQLAALVLIAAIVAVYRRAASRSAPPQENAG